MERFLQKFSLFDVSVVALQHAVDQIEALVPGGQPLGLRQLAVLLGRDPITPLEDGEKPVVVVVAHLGRHLRQRELTAADELACQLHFQPLDVVAGRGGCTS